MACTDGIVKAITSDCTTQKIGGLEVESYVMNRKDFIPTFDVTNESKITDVAMAATKTAFKLTGVNKNFNAGHDRVIAEGFADTFTHYLSFKAFEVLAEDVENIDNLKDIVVIVETKNETTSGEGMFLAYGVKAGLYVTTDTLRHNADNASRNIEMASKEQETEEFSCYTVLDTDYATTKAALEALLA